MTYIGKVKTIEVLDNLKVVTVLLDKITDMSVNIGEKVVFGDKEDVAIKGWKFWSERSLLDIVIDAKVEGIEVGERVSIVGS